jgi:hypothetical protein
MTLEVGYTNFWVSRQDIILGHIKASPGITAKKIRDITGWPRRSLFTVLTQLIENDKIVKLRALRDARQYKYYLKP